MSWFSGRMVLLNCVVLALALALCSSAKEVTFDGRALIIDGERKIIISGSIHYPRSTPGMWPSLMTKAKEGGINAIETYVFWNAHEPQQGQYDFSGNNDLVKFIQTIQQQGLHAILRIGPYVCAEWNYGGFPVWLHNIPGIQFRTKNDIFMAEMQKFTTLIVNKMKDNKLFASQGGPIILAQIENEYGNIKGSYGEAGNEYVKWCAELAQSYNVSVPWVMCQEGDAPQPMINTCNGFYCDQFRPNNKNSPKIWTENWTGWFKNWGSRDPLRTAEDLAFAVGRFFQYGGSLQNYYMYHGGTNFGRTSGGPYITTSYDYNAPLDEYGNIHQPKWGHLKELHHHLMSMEKVLTCGDVKHTEYGHLTTATEYTFNGKSSCFFGNAENGDRDIIFRNRTYTVPGWSVTILPDCETEAYNTAWVNTQTTLREMKSSSVAKVKKALTWEWRNEKIENMLHGEVDGSVLTANRLLDQKLVTNDTSDYLWLFTGFHLMGSDPLFNKKHIKLRVQTRGHILHAFVNNHHIGSQYARNGKYDFTFEKQVRNLMHGSNQIVLLSATVGLPNYGAHFENSEVGVHGPVELIADGETVRDLSNNEWFYKVGLDGERYNFFDPNHQFRKPWLSDNLPLNQNFTWYKTTFPTPKGREAVVVDLLGMGKGHAWVNGKSIGRYWPSYLANENGCSSNCDFHGAYYDSKCVTNCGKPSQRWYHIPRSYLKNTGDNTLVLFEEFGGGPLDIDIQTTRVRKVCAKPYEGSTLELSCHDRTISDIKFVSFGNPRGSCENFQKGSCDSSTAFSVIKKACLGKRKCSIEVSKSYLGLTGCKKKPNRLAVEVTC
ncbi:beta-galactosidase 15-like [Momordica charantia]|uniref:Beta-galactosidase n=1 Tax=Momordica charantia TaxID=3673 RepID=A0A6J1CRE5_MOMCH|nr:beta-galactosidase 15-like [Momordica charantia]